MLRSLCFATVKEASLASRWRLPVFVLSGRLGCIAWGDRFAVKALVWGVRTAYRYHV
jgi:hypothetical protein